MRVSGTQVRSIRQALGLPVNQFATVLGVHQSSVHRWEAAGDRTARVEGVPLSVLTALGERVRETPKKQAKQAGEDIVRALVVGGVLVALALLIAFALGKKRKDRKT